MSNPSIDHYIGAIRVMLLAFLAASPLAQSQPQARLGISPDRYEVTFEPAGGKTESLMVKNLSNEPITVSLSVANWELDEQNRIREISPQENSLDQWLVVNPLEVTIPANTPQTIRWAIMPRMAPTPGEYRALIYIEEKLPQQDPLEEKSVRINMRFGIPIYAHIGEVRDDARIVTVQADESGKSVVVELSNEGNRHARFQGSYGIWPSSTFPDAKKALSLMQSRNETSTDYDSIPMNDVVLLPGSRRTVVITPETDISEPLTLQFDASFGTTPVQNTVHLRH